MSDRSSAEVAPAGWVVPPASNQQGGAAWSAVGSLSLGVFGLVTAEFLPASLLTPIAHDLGISAGTAGQAVTMTAVVAGVAGPALVIGTARIDRRMVVWSLSLLLVLSDLLASVASNIWVLLAARVGLGVALGGVWSLAAALCLRLVPAALMPRAMSIVFTGMTAASVCAPAFGVYIGGLWGWRATFLAASGIGLLALLIQVMTLPRMPPADAPGLDTFVLLLRRPSIRIGLITVILVMSGHFAGFTYIRPFMEQVPRLGVRMISLVLLALGVGGFFGNLAGGVLAARSARLGAGLAAFILAAATLTLLAYGASASVALFATAVWGFGFGAFPISIQTWTTQAAPDHAESAGALLVSTFQVGISVGAVAGGLLVDGLGAPGVIGYCGLATLIGGFTMLTLARPRNRPETGTA